jgi:TATA-binding protein-associated factor
MPYEATAQASRKIRARHRLITTGTPVQNNVNELWATFDFLMPHFLGSSSAFSSTFAKSITKGQLPGASAGAISEGMERLKSLHQQCLPFILRREKEQVLQELPPKIVSTIQVQMSALQEKIYSAFLSRPSGQSSIDELRRAMEGRELKDDKISAGSEAFKSLLFMRLVCTHPALVSGITWTEDEQQSSTDWLGLEASGKLLALVELLRGAGIYEDATGGADNDRSLLYCGDDESSRNFDGLVQSTTDCGFDINARIESGSAGTSKCILFAQFSKSLDVVEHLVLNALMPALQYVRLDGSVPVEKRALIAQRFNSDPEISIMLATTRVGGLGLNLTGWYFVDSTHMSSKSSNQLFRYRKQSGADMVIFLENDFNPFADLQAADRAHRIGQHKVVNVYNLVTSGTVEERIIDLQARKVAMSDAIVNSDNSTLYSMGTDRLLDIFTARGDTTEDNDNTYDMDVLAAKLSDEYACLSVPTFLKSLSSDSCVMD